MVLAPALPRFLQDHPDILLEVIVEDRLIDLVANGFDAGIRFGESVERDMVAVRVGPDLRTVVVGTPGYFEQHPRPSAPADLTQHRLQHVAEILQLSNRLLTLVNNARIAQRHMQPAFQHPATHRGDRFIQHRR